ncbi:MAG: hypothetical protein AAF483_28065 [Planctomycetota bacterium]
MKTFVTALMLLGVVMIQRRLLYRSKGGVALTLPKATTLATPDLNNVPEANMYLILVKVRHEEILPYESEFIPQYVRPRWEDSSTGFVLEQARYAYTTLLNEERLVFVELVSSKLPSFTTSPDQPLNPILWTTSTSTAKSYVHVGC